MSQPPNVLLFPPGDGQRLWKKWAMNQVNPAFSKYPTLRSQVLEQLDKSVFETGYCQPPPSSQPAWNRLKEVYGVHTSFVGEIPSVVDCEVVRIVNKCRVHEYIDGLLRAYGWDSVKCCDPSINAPQKVLPGYAFPGSRDNCPVWKLRSIDFGISSSAVVCSGSLQANQPSLPSSGSSMPSSGQISSPAVAVPAAQVPVVQSAPRQASSQRPASTTTTSFQDSKVSSNQSSSKDKKAAPPGIAPSATMPGTSQPCQSSQASAFQVPAQTISLSGVASASTPNASSFGGCQTMGNAQLPTNSQAFPFPASSPDQSTGKSIFQQQKGQSTTKLQPFTGVSAVSCQSKPSASYVSTNPAHSQTPVAGGSSKFLPAAKPLPGVKKDDASLARPFGQSTTPSLQANLGQVPANGGFSMFSGRPFLDASTTPLTTFAAPVTRKNNTSKISAAPGAEPVPSIGENGIAKTQAVSPSNLKVGNPDSACPKSGERTHPTKTEEDIVLSPRVASQTAVIDITDEEEGDVCQNVQGTHSQQVERLSARLADDLRPMLHEYVRDKLTAANQDAAAHLQRRTRNLLGRQSNAHFGFSVLRDVEVKTMESMTNEASALIEGVLAQISDTAKNVTSQGIKRETEAVEEVATEGDRPAKRSRIRKA